MQRSRQVGSSRSAERSIPGSDPRPDRRRAATRDRPALAQLFEGHIIPQLIDDHDGSCDGIGALGLAPEVARFTEAVLAIDSAACMVIFDEFVQRGVAVDRLFEQLLVPAALSLGKMWENDARDFLDVTRGMEHIHQIILAHSSDFCGGQKHSEHDYRILLASLPQERHRLGLCLVRADFWRAGWDVSCAELNFMNDLEKLVSRSRYDAIGISAGRVGDAPMLARSLDRVRSASRNVDVMIVTGGYAFQRNPELSAAIGADFTAVSGRDAVMKIQNRIATRAAARQG